MKFLADQDVYEVTVRLLEAEGYQVLRARDAGLATASDEDLLAFAYQNGYTLITRDKGFGQFVFSRDEPHSGIILLRVEPKTLTEVHKELLRFLREHTESEIRCLFVVIEPGRHRIRRRGG